jgi:CheY-like chemotaxis protein
MKILLVDDDIFLRDMYATKFSEIGDEVTSAEDGTQALTQLAAKTFDVIIMDMVMPKMSGIELLKAIKDADLARGAKCIVLSNQGEESDITAAYVQGAIGYIIKAELIPSEVVAKVHTIVS